MEYQNKSWTVGKLIKGSAENRIKANREYQRGRAWSAPQQKQFIDSILRGYPVPTIFLHDKKTDDKAYDIIDGQQRINALREYLEGNYKLLPRHLAEKNFPSLVFGKHDDRNWLGKSFTEVSDKHKSTLKDKKIPIIILQGTDNEVRDLFIRLQEGSVLNDQERRDAWPGDFTTFIFDIGGRSGRSEPHRFFREVMHIPPPRGPKSSRGRVRKIATQLYQLHSSYANGMKIKGISKNELNQLYMNNVKFAETDPQGETREQFKNCLEMLCTVFYAEASTNRGNLRNHSAFHLMLLATLLLKKGNFRVDECMQIGGNLRDAYKDFSNKCAAANRMNTNAQDEDEYWLRYVFYTKQSTDSPSTIKDRHEFFLQKMLEKMSDSEPKFRGPNMPDNAPEILERACGILKQETDDLSEDLPT